MSVPVVMCMCGVCFGIQNGRLATAFFQAVSCRQELLRIAAAQQRSKDRCQAEIRNEGDSEHDTDSSEISD